MSIRINDSAQPSFGGEIAATMDDIAASFAGSATPTTDNNGAINRALDDITASFRDTVSYPLTYTPRGGALNMYQTGTVAEDDRKAIGLMDACHIIGFNSGDQADTSPPASGYIARVDGNREILAANPGAVHYLFTYFVFNEALDDGSIKATKLYAETGPNSTDWWFRDAAGNQVIQFTIGATNAYGINLSDYAAVDANGDNYAEWHADNVIQPLYITPHVVAGIKIGGPNAINWFLDNCQHHSNKSGIDPDQSGSNNDMQDYYDSEEATHVAADAVAVTAYSAVRANMMKGIRRVRSNNPGILLLPNTNQHADKPLDRNDKPESFAELRNCILEYRLGGDTLKADYEGGFSEGNSNNSNPRSGVLSDGTLSGAAGNWLQAYFNMYQSVRFAQPPTIVPASFWVQCLQSGSTGPGGKTIWSPIPASNAVWSMARWAMITAWIAGAHAAITGIQVGASTAGRAQSTPLFDEYGLINGAVDYGFGAGSTKLFYKWMGPALEDPPIVAKADGHWGREFTNAYVLLNPDNNAANSPITIDVSALPSGATEWTRILGSQDSSTNTGNDASADFQVPPVNGIVLPRKPWYDAL